QLEMRPGEDSTRRFFSQLTPGPDKRGGLEVDDLPPCPGSVTPSLTRSDSLKGRLITLAETGFPQVPFEVFREVEGVSPHGTDLPACVGRSLPGCRSRQESRRHGGREGV